MACGTVTGTASCGTAGGSRRLQLSKSRATGTWYVFDVEWNGLCFEASSKVLATAPRALLTVPVLTRRPLPKSPARTWLAKAVVTMLRWMFDVFLRYGSCLIPLQKLVQCSQYFFLDS